MRKGDERKGGEGYVNSKRNKGYEGGADQSYDDFYWFHGGEKTFHFGGDGCPAECRHVLDGVRGHGERKVLSFFFVWHVKSLSD